MSGQSSIRRAATAGALLLAFLAGAPSAQTPPATAFRLHGTVEPVRSQLVTAPRLTGSGNGPLIIIHLAKPGTIVQKGEALVEFDRAAQIKSAHDREAEYQDFVAQISKKRADAVIARGKDETELVEADNAVKSAELDLLDKDLVAPNVAEQNKLAFEEAQARLAQLRKTFDLKRKTDAADVRILEIQRDRALNAWKHAEGNADKMRILSPLAGLVVAKTIWKQGSFGEVQEGEEVRPGMPILEVVDPSAMRVRARVNQADVTRIRVGQAVHVTLDSYPARPLAGRLDQLSPIGAPSGLSNRVRTFIAVFSITDSDPHVLPDLAAAVDVDVP